MTESEESRLRVDASKRIPKLCSTCLHQNEEATTTGAGHGDKEEDGAEVERDPEEKEEEDEEKEEREEGEGEKEEGEKEGGEDGELEQNGYEGSKVGILGAVCEKCGEYQCSDCWRSLGNVCSGCYYP